jgi:hypothetical protein
MKKIAAIAIVIMIMLIGCTKKNIIPTTPIEQTATATMTSINTSTATSVASLTRTSTIIMTATMTMTSTINITSTGTATPTTTATNTTTMLVTATATRTITQTRTLTPVPTATPNNCVWCGPGGGYMVSNITNIMDPAYTCGTGKALSVNSTSVTTVTGQLILNTSVNVVSTVYIAYKINKTGSVGAVCLLNGSGGSQCTNFTVGGNLMTIPYSGVLKEVDLQINGVNGYIIIDCIQYY